jgi:hypothetical protein
MPQDFEVDDQGSIVLIRPITDAARNWCNEYLPEDCMMYGSAYAIEHRYADAIIEGFADDGLTA